MALRSQEQYTADRLIPCAVHEPRQIATWRAGPLSLSHLALVAVAQLQLGCGCSSRSLLRCQASSIVCCQTLKATTARSMLLSNQMRQETLVELARKTSAQF